jgi:hypothetical protein
MTSFWVNHPHCATKSWLFKLSPYAGDAHTTTFHRPLPTNSCPSPLPLPHPPIHWYVYVFFIAYKQMNYTCSHVS